MADVDNNSISTRGPKPVPHTLLIAVIAAVGIFGLYFSVGCRREWISIVGLVLDLMGAIGLVIFDRSTLRPQLFADDLEDLYHDLSKEQPPSIKSRSKTYTILRASLQENHELPEEPEFTIIDDSTLQIEGGSDFETEEHRLLVVRSRLERQIERERGNLRKFSLSLLVLGFSLQLVGAYVVQIPAAGFVC